MTPSIEPISLGHAEAFHALFDAVAREKHFLASLQAPPIEKLREFLASVMKTEAPFHVATIHSELIGWCDAQPRKYESENHRAVLGIGLAKPWRGKGFGRALMARTLDAAFASGFEKVELTVRDDNSAAKKLYRRMGFRVEGFFHDAARVEGQYYDVLGMALSRRDYLAHSAASGVAAR